MEPEVQPEFHWPPGWGPKFCDSVVTHERRIAAPANAVVARLVAVEAWPQWQHTVTRTVLLEQRLHVGSRFLVACLPSAFDGTVRELDHPTRFGWSAVSNALSFYQNWLLLEEPGGGTLAIFHEAARGPAARLGSAARAELTRSWVDALTRSTTW